MNKVELVKAIADETKYATKDVKIVLDTMDCIILSELKEGSDVKTGIASFVVKNTSARVGRNPKTGESVNVPAGKKVTVKLSKVLKESVK